MLKKLLPLILILALLLTACGAPADAEEPDDPPETSPEAPSSEEPEEDVLPELVRLLTAETVQLSDSVTFTTPAAADISLDEETAAMYVNNTLLVFAQAGADRSEIEALAESSGASIVGETPVLDLYQFRFPEALDLDGLRSRIEALEASDLVDAVDVDYLMEISGEYTPDDPWYDSEYPDADANRWGIEAIHAEEAWDYLGYMNPVTIGLMEEVTSTDHKDLNVLTVINASAASAATSTFYASVDLGNHDHGTHVAGTMAAIPDNGIGITGVCAVPGTDVLICNDWGNISVGHFMSAITTMVTFYDVQVINISQSSCQPVQCFAASQGVEAAQEALAEQAETAARSLRRLLDHGFEFVLCLAAGNENDETYYKDSTAQLDGALRRTYGYTSDKSALFAGDTAYSGANARYSHFLAAIDDAELRNRIIVVGNAMQSADGGYESAPSSNVGLRVDIMAPGKDIYSLEYEGGYRTMSGTSMAAPHVSGVAAMLFACDPTLTGAEVKDYICSTADHTYALRFDGVEAGMLRADTAVEALLTDLGCLQPAGFPTALDMMDMTHEELRTLGWDSVWGASSGQSTAGFSEEYILLDASYAFTFVLEDPKGLSTPGYLHVRDGQNGGMALSITDSIATGMTYGQIAAAGGSLTPLDENNQARLETEDGWRITLLFDGSGGGAVLTAAKITPAANAQS